MGRDLFWPETTPEKFPVFGPSLRISPHPAKSPPIPGRIFRDKVGRRLFEVDIPKENNGASFGVPEGTGVHVLGKLKPLGIRGGDIKTGTSVAVAIIMGDDGYIESPF